MIRSALLEAVHAALADIGVEERSNGVVVERPANPDHGDWSTNAALVSAKALAANPREVASKLVEALEAAGVDHVEALEIAGPGFVNFRLGPSWTAAAIKAVVAAGQDDYARSTIGSGTSINIEFVSANPTGPLHAGHGRWAAYGDSTARILQRCGYSVHRETYINDRGVQIEQFGKSLAARKAGEEPPEDGYVGEYVAEWAAEMPDDADPAEWGLQRGLAEHRAVLNAMHVHFDSWSSERESVAAGQMDSALDRLRAGGHTYEADGATWLRTTDFGDDKDRVLIKADGSYTYLLPDIGYHESKFDRGDLIIDVLGADHHGYVPRMRAALEALGHAPDTYEARIGQNVKLMRDGQELKMSKRAGTFVELAELIDDVGPDVARMAYLLQSIDTALVVDIDLLKSQASENPVYYVQYAHARIHSIGRKAAELGIERLPIDDVDLTVLSHDRERALVAQLSSLGDVVDLAAAERAPHRISNWVRELAANYHGFQHDCPILKADVDSAVRDARLWLVEATRIGLAIGLDLLGVEAPEQM